MKRPRRYTAPKYLVVLGLLISLFTSERAWGQKIHFTDTTNYWIEYSVYSNPEVPPSMNYIRYTKYYYSGDTTINGYKYQLLNEQATEIRTTGISNLGRLKTAALREDTTESKVFALMLNPWAGAMPDTSESLLYDYNLQTGDTFTVKGSTSALSYYVTATGTIQINGIPHRTWSLNPLFPGVFFFGYLQVVEGVGITVYPLFSRLPHDGAEFGAYRLECFSNKDAGTIIGNPSWYNANCFLTDVKDQMPAVPAISVYPNPATDYISFQYEGNSAFELTMFDITCRIIKEGHSSKRKVIMDIADIPAGMYFYQVRINAQTFFGKILKR